VSWDASDYPSGVYFYRLVVGDPSAAQGKVLPKQENDFDEINFI